MLGSNGGRSQLGSNGGRSQLESNGGRSQLGSNGGRSQPGVLGVATIFSHSSLLAFPEAHTASYI